MVSLIWLSELCKCMVIWQTLQRDSQSALVIGKSCSKALRHSIRSKPRRNWSKSYSPRVIFGCFWWRHWYQ